MNLRLLLPTTTPPSHQKAASQIRAPIRTTTITMSTSLSVRPSGIFNPRPTYPRPPARRTEAPQTLWPVKINRYWITAVPYRLWLVPTITTTTIAHAGSRADDSAPSEMSVENALKLLGVSEGDSFDDILRAKNSILATCKDDQEMIARVEAAYDMLLMQSLTQRRAGKVANSSIRYADVKPVAASGIGSMPRWLQSTIKNSAVIIEAPSSANLGIQAGVYGAMMVLTYVNGSSSPSAGPLAGADVPGLILATSFGASLYFMTKKNVKLGKATLITMGALVAGAVVGSAVENWLQVDIVPFLGLQSPAAVVSEFILLSQLLVSLYLSKVLDLTTFEGMVWVEVIVKAKLSLRHKNLRVDNGQKERLTQPD